MILCQKPWCYSVFYFKYQYGSTDLHLCGTGAFMVGCPSWHHRNPPGIEHPTSWLKDPCKHRKHCKHWNSSKMNNTKIIKSQYFKRHLCWAIFRWMHCEIRLKMGFSPSYFSFQDINVSTVISLLNGGKLWGITWDVNTQLTHLDTAVIAVNSPLCVRQAWETTERGYMSNSGSSVASVHPPMAMLQVCSRFT